MTSVRTKILVHITLAIFLVEAVLLAFSIMARKRQLLAAETAAIRKTADVAGILFSESAARLSADQFDRFIGDFAKTQKTHIMIVDQDIHSWTDHAMCGLGGGWRRRGKVGSSRGGFRRAASENQETCCIRHANKPEVRVMNIEMKAGKMEIGLFVLRLGLGSFLCLWSLDKLFEPSGSAM